MKFSAKYLILSLILGTIICFVCCFVLSLIFNTEAVFAMSLGIAITSTIIYCTKIIVDTIKP